MRKSKTRGAQASARLGGAAHSSLRGRALGAKLRLKGAMDMKMKSVLSKAVACAALALCLGQAWAMAEDPPAAVAAAAKAKAADKPKFAPLGDAPATIATRMAIQALSAAASAQAAGMKSDPSSLARMGALPAGLVKWGQIKSPWADGQFLDIELDGEGKSAHVALVAPTIPAEACAQTVVELAMRPEMDRMEVGKWRLAVGDQWKIDDMPGLCAAMKAGPVKLWGKLDPPLEH